MENLLLQIFHQRKFKNELIFFPANIHEYVFSGIHSSEVWQKDIIGSFPKSSNKDPYAPLN